MTTSIFIEDVLDKAKLFSSILQFYAPYDVTLTIWGDLPDTLQQFLSAVRSAKQTLRSRAFKESEWHLSRQTLPLLLESLAQESIISKVTWGISKAGTPLSLCRTWADVNLDVGGPIQQDDLARLVEQLKKDKFIEGYEIIEEPANQAL